MHGRKTEEEKADKINIQTLFDTAITASISVVRGFIAFLERVLPHHQLLEKAKRELRKQIINFLIGNLSQQAHSVSQ